MLSKRLKSLTKYINKEDSIIDIGCDHALLDIYLIKNNYVNNMIASDIHKSAYNQGLNNIKLYNLVDKIDIRLGDGLSVLTDIDNVDTILISGMGSTNIINILNNSFISKINKIIIQSNNDYELLRSNIVKLGYYIKDEEYFVDKGKDYINIVFIKGNKNYSNDEMKYGPILIKNKDYMTHELNNLNKIYRLIPDDKKELKLSLKEEIDKVNNYIQMT